MNDSPFFKSVERYGVSKQDFENMCIVSNYAVSWKGLVDFVEKYKSMITGHFTFLLNKEWYKVDIDTDGVILSIFRTRVEKPIRSQKVLFSDYIQERLSYPAPILIEENRRL